MAVIAATEGLLDPLAAETVTADNLRYPLGRLRVCLLLQTPHLHLKMPVLAMLLVLWPY